jgi:hypothetical protein
LKKAAQKLLFTLGRWRRNQHGPSLKKFFASFFSKKKHFLALPGLAWPTRKKKAAHEAPPSLGRKRPRKTGEKTHPVEGVYRRSLCAVTSELCAAQNCLKWQRTAPCFMAFRPSCRFLHKIPFPIGEPERSPPPVPRCPRRAQESRASRWSSPSRKSVRCSPPAVPPAAPASPARAG